MCPAVLIVGYTKGTPKLVAQREAGARTGYTSKSRPVTDREEQLVPQLLWLVCA